MGEINEIKDIAVAAAKRYSCIDILQNVGYPIRTRGNQAYTYCYNCGGRTGKVEMDKFSVNTTKNMYYCFGCGTGGGPAKLYSELNGISFIEASLLLACKQGDITEEQLFKVNNCRKDVYDKLKSDSKVYSICEEIESADAEHKAPADVVDLVYRTMLEEMEEFKLDNDSYKYLINKRYLSDEDIKAIGFFSYKKAFSVDSLFNKIKAKNPNFTYDMFVGVPGFFFEYTNKEMTQGKWRFKKPYYDCLGIPLRNYEGKIIALQLRYMGEKKTQNKYFYISSAGIEEKGKKLAYGSSSGSPVSVFYPKKLKAPIFYIGEGAFKMNEIAKDGYVSFSCQGVNTFHYAIDEAKACMKSDNLLTLAKRSNMKGQQQVKFVIVFDADMYYKIQVLEAAMTACDCLRKAFPDNGIYFLLWDKKYGKGYDDMKFYCNSNNLDYRKMVKAMDYKTFVSMARASVVEADNLYLSSNEHLNDGIESGNTIFRRNDGWKKAMNKVFFENRILPFINGQ